jgi:hypothetical protein
MELLPLVVAQVETKMVLPVLLAALAALVRVVDPPLLVRVEQGLGAKVVMVVQVRLGLITPVVVVVAHRRLVEMVFLLVALVMAAQVPHHQSLVRQ